MPYIDTKDEHRAERAQPTGSMTFFVSVSTSYKARKRLASAEGMSDTKMRISCSLKYKDIIYVKNTKWLTKKNQNEHTIASNEQTHERVALAYVLIKR